MSDTEYFHPRGREISLATNEYDGTYGASLGCFSARQCLVCAAVVDAQETQRHAAWHESLFATIHTTRCACLPAHSMTANRE